MAIKKIISFALWTGAGALAGDLVLGDTVRKWLTDPADKPDETWTKFKRYAGNAIPYGLGATAGAMVSHAIGGGFKAEVPKI